MSEMLAFSLISPAVKRLGLPFEMPAKISSDFTVIRLSKRGARSSLGLLTVWRFIIFFACFGDSLGFRVTGKGQPLLYSPCTAFLKRDWLFTLLLFFRF